MRPSKAEIAAAESETSEGEAAEVELLETPESPQIKVEALGAEIQQRQTEISGAKESMATAAQEIAAARESLGLPETDETSPRIASQQERINNLQSEVARLHEQRASQSGAEVAPGNYSHPVPSLVEKGKPGSGFENAEFTRFTPEQRREVEANKFSYDGVTYEQGDLVEVGGNKYRVMSIEAHAGNDQKIVTKVDYDADPSGGSHKEFVVPATLILQATEIEGPDGEWRVDEGSEQVRRAS